MSIWPCRELSKILAEVANGRAELFGSHTGDTELHNSDLRLSEHHNHGDELCVFIDTTI